MTQEDYEPKLSFVTLDDDNETILLNGEPKYAVALPVNISRKNAADKRGIIEKLILDGCDKFGFDYVIEENIRNLAKEVVDQLYERPRELKIVDSVSDVIRKNRGKVILTAAKIVGVSPPYKMIAQVILECPVCKENWVSDFSDKPRISFRPDIKYCPNCKLSDRGDLNDLRIIYEHVDAKSITLQDVDVVKEDIEKLHVVLLKDQTRNVRVGETVSITGDVDVLNPSGSGGKKATTIMYAKHIKYEREEEKPITEEDVAEFRKFSDQPDVINKLVEKFAPNVIGHSDAKLGILRSAVSVRETKSITGGIRSRLHTLLAGDPGTAKSMLAEEAIKIVPNSRFVTAQHISVKSALAIIDKEVDGSKMLMLGAVPQARNAICCINEIGSMLFEDQQHLADVLEEGRFTIDKHGIYQQIDSPTTIVATANPHGERWNRSAGSPSIDQIPVKDNILDRFDQIYPFEDFQTTEERREFAMSKGEIYQDPQSVKTDDEFLKRYLQYAATSLPEPVLTPEAVTMLSDFWIRMAEQGIAANRTLDSLMRMAKAQARLHLHTEVTPEIVNEVTTYVQLMLVKMGRRVDPSVADPRDLAFNEIIQYVNTLDDNTHISFIEAAKHVCETNNSVKQYLGGGTIWAVNSNKKLRAVMDRFTNGGTDKPKVGRNGLAIIVTNLHPLTFVKAERQSLEQTPSLQQQEQKPETTTENTRAPESPRSLELDLRADSRNLGHQGGHDGSPENELKNGESDPSDLSDHGLTRDLSQVIEKCILDEHVNNKGYFTKDDFVYALIMRPKQEGWTEDQAEQTLLALVEEGKVVEVEPGKYKARTTT
jgi:replicative DNA helicase Mcm